MGVDIRGKAVISVVYLFLVIERDEPKSPGLISARAGAVNYAVSFSPCMLAASNGMSARDAFRIGAYLAALFRSN
jgi:hypothetical protein